MGRSRRLVLDMIAPSNSEFDLRLHIFGVEGVNSVRQLFELQQLPNNSLQ